MGVGSWIVLWCVVAGLCGLCYAWGVRQERNSRWDPGDPTDPAVACYVNLPNGLWRVRAYHVLACERERVTDGREPSGATVVPARNWTAAQEQMEGAYGLPILWDWKSGTWSP